MENRESSCAMKIWYLPPKYIDTKNLEIEHTHICMYLGHIGSSDVWAGYLFLRLMMIEDELNKRCNDIRYESTTILNPFDYTLQARPNELIMRNEKNLLLSNWSTRMLEDNILDLMDKLAPVNTEDIYLESEWNIEMYRKEYGL
jgi:hypothetical protein